MPKRLILMRHAKSSWQDTDLDDHARVLNARGRRSCDAIGPWLAARGHVPDQILCSDSARTRETWDRLAPHFPPTPTPALMPELYLASAKALRTALSEASGDTVILLTHNPGVGDLAAQLVQAAPAHPRFDIYPTLATLVLEFPIDAWSDLKPGTGKVLDFIVPRELTD
ncbi:MULTISPECIES: SixA phosphatase family protein [unclassified Meridianimarinicoccus]|uniref:SixA phosphatase family protein n=1 Tax=unclassified Meridianimarinicoccus TaxID=2923344 RepID=UPI001866EA62|nr:histidine phosphatase family protein [Fluviibacterium sp. MJW13]